MANLEASLLFQEKFARQIRSFMHTIFIDYSIHQKLFFAICVVKNMHEILFKSNKK